MREEHAQIQCDECKEMVLLNTMNFHKDNLLNSVERYYIKCPNCKEEYTSYYLNDEMKEIQEEIKRLRNKPDLKIKQKNKINILSNKLIRLHAELKTQVETGA